MDEGGLMGLAADLTVESELIVAPPGGNLLTVDDVNFSYGHLQVLFGVSLTVQPGEALALLGTNGAGKSTLLRVVAGLVSPTRGTIRLDGADITGIPAERIAMQGELALISGGRSVFSDMTVSENLDIESRPARRRGRAWLRQRRAVVFEYFPRLAERTLQRAGSLSGGEQQQLALARALLLEPKLLCIDELSLGLAPVVVKELLAIVRNIQQSGVGVILVEQSLNIAAEMCPRAVFMEKGQIRFEGPTADLLANNDIARAVFFGSG
jgi:ABC-type branched-subunit amino acid transport system ATPase component